MNKERLVKVLVAPYISEKSATVADKYRQFAFKVLPDATKPEIKAAVEALFKVEVEKVTVNTVKSKKRRMGRMIGTRSGWKKAYVSLREGNDIDFTSIQ